MNEKLFFTSVTRISDLRDAPFEVRPISREKWEMGDYVVTEVTESVSRRIVELSTGRVIEVAEGDMLVGAFGRREATLEATGDWSRIGEDGACEILSGGGLIGREVSRSMLEQPLIHLQYRGHPTRQGAKVTTHDFVPASVPRRFELPVLLIVGTSMSAGKTTTARLLIRQLKLLAPLKVIGAKLAGAARYRDALSMMDAGADFIFDFVDAGLPSTVCAEELYCSRLENLLSRMAALEADVAVIELGASPLEPYNGALAWETLKGNARLTVLCASDPYSVIGVMNAYGTEPDFVTGPASNTEAGVKLVEKLADVRAVNLLDRRMRPGLGRLLEEKLAGTLV
jgi:hypothetical protein